jgi:hypothetical protein
LSKIQSAKVHSSIVYNSWLKTGKGKPAINIKTGKEIKQQIYNNNRQEKL